MKNKISMKNDGTVSFEEGFNRFITFKITMGLVEESITHYKVCYKYFAVFFDVTKDCLSINEDTLLAYIRYLKNRNERVTDVTICTYLRGIRAILYYLMEKEYLKPFKIKLPRTIKKIKETYTKAELERLLKKPNLKKCTFSEYRNWVLACYFLGTGNRLNTVVNIKIGDVDFISNEIKLREVKNKKQYTFPLSTSLEKILIEYIQYRKGTSDDYLFCTDFGRKISKEAIKTAMKRYNRARGVDKTSIHLYRHTFAKKWVLNGGDIFRLQKLLGHSSLEMVKEYVSLYGHDLRDSFDRFNPLEEMKTSFEKSSMIHMDK